MKLNTWTTYCGGRILTGLYRPQDVGHSTNDEKLWEQYAKAIKSGNTPPASVPNDLELFKWILRQISTGGQLKACTAQAIGTIIAVTNSSQSLAAKHLAACGFTEVASNEKYKGYGVCKTWIVDYHAVLFPLLKDMEQPKITKPKEVVKPLFSKLGGKVDDTQPFAEGEEVYFTMNNPDGGAEFGITGHPFTIRTSRVTGDGSYYYTGPYGPYGSVSVPGRALSRINPLAKTTATTPWAGAAGGVAAAQRISPITGLPVRRYVRRAA